MQADLHVIPRSRPSQLGSTLVDYKHQTLGSEGLATLFLWPFLPCQLMVIHALNAKSTQGWAGCWREEILARGARAIGYSHSFMLSA